MDCGAVGELEFKVTRMRFVVLEGCQDYLHLDESVGNEKQTKVSRCVKCYFGEGVSYGV